MKRIALITPCILPVPATLGGAVEELITRIIIDNEIKEDFFIDLFSLIDDNAETDLLHRTYVTGIEYRASLRFADRILDKIHRTIPGSEGYRLFDKTIAQAFEERLGDLEEPYTAVIIENQISIAKEIINRCSGLYEFPFFFHMHNDVDIYRNSEGIKELASYGVQFIAVSEYIKNQILKYAEDAVVHVLYNGTKLEETSNVSERNNSEIISFLYAGRIIQEKGVYELVKAFDKLLDIADSQLRDRLRLDIIGFSNDQQKYERKVIKLAGERKNFITCKNRIATSEMNCIYSKYDVVVMPTMNEEPFGLVALETMAKGLPLITTNSGALPEVAGEGALIVDKSGDFITNLANAMLALASDKALREELGKKAYARAREVKAFDIQNYYDNFANIIDNNNDNGKISVVVPVYNVSDYLGRCVSSLLNQTYSNIEILLIDDGSTDGSERLCDDYAAMDPRVKVIHQKNMGLSGARNTGIDEADGDYIFFCDSDDFIQRETLEYMYNKLCRDNADIVACGFSHVWDDYEKSGREDVFTSLYPGTFSGRKAVIEMMTKNSICSVAWNKLYKKKLFDGVRFPVGALHEDEAMVYKLLYGAKIVSYTPNTFYKYFQRSSGIMGGNLVGRSMHLISALTDRIRYFEEKNDTELVQYSRIALLEHIKYIYRNVTDEQDRKELSRLYGEKITYKTAPVIAGVKKCVALLLWKYLKY